MKFYYNITIHELADVYFTKLFQRLFIVRYIVKLYLPYKLTILKKMN